MKVKLNTVLSQATFTHNAMSFGSAPQPGKEALPGRVLSFRRRRNLPSGVTEDKYLHHR